MAHNQAVIPSNNAAVVYDPNGHTVLGRVLVEPAVPGGVSIAPIASDTFLSSILDLDTPFLQLLRLVCTADVTAPGNLVLKERATSPDGATASIFARTVLLTGLTNIDAGMFGHQITISGAATAASNGTFFITEVVDSTSVKYVNQDAATPDANNGTISWSVDAESGAAASIETFELRLTGLTGITPAQIGRTITISGAATAANNGTFVITGTSGINTVFYENTAGVAPDASNGLISWSTERTLLLIPVVAAYKAGQILEYQFPTPLRGFPGFAFAVDTPAGSGTWLWLPNGFFMTEAVL